MVVLKPGTLTKHWLYSFGTAMLSLPMMHGVDREETIERLRAIRGTQRHQSSNATEEECVWPHCLPSCEPCATKEVDTCLLSYVSEYIFGCNEAFGPTECFLDKCLCQDGFCADEKQLRCVPQVCRSGSSPPAFKPNWWVQSYARLGGGQDFPSPEDMDLLYWAKIGAFPSLVMVWGALMATITFIEMFCRAGNHRKDANDEMTIECPRQASGQQPSPRIRSGSQCNAVATDGDDASGVGTKGDDSGMALIGSHSEVNVPKRPSMFPMLTVSIIILLTTFFGIRMRSASHSRNELIVFNQLSRAQRDLQIVAGQIEIIDATAQRIKRNMEELSFACRSALFIDNIDEYAAEYVDMIEQMAVAIRPIPEQLGGARDSVMRNSFLAVWIPQAPLLLIVLICTAIVVEAIFTSCWGSSAFGDAVYEHLRYSSIAFVLMIILVSLCSGLILLVVITLSQFCMDVDNNVYDTIVYSTGPNMTDVHNISQFYLFGTVRNPIIGYADMAEKYVNHVERIYHEHIHAFELVEAACPELVDVNVSRIAIEAREVLDNCKIILAGENVWPYYNRIIRAGACDSIVESIGWSSSLIFVVGLIFFPLCAILTHRFLVRWAAWATSEEAVVMRQNRLPGHDDLEPTMSQKTTKHIADDSKS